MTVSASTQVPKTSDPAVFQRQCKVLFECVLNDPTVKEFGSPGQRQNGVDLYGRRRDVALDHWVGIQCKLTTKAKLPKGTVRDEATQALEFQPPLREFIIITTAEDDTAMDVEAAEFTNEQAKNGRDFTAQVWGWKTLQTQILQYERAITAFSPDAFPHLRALNIKQDKMEELLRESSTRTVDSFAIIQRQLSTIAYSIGAVESPDGTKFDTFIDRQIDQFRDLINDNKPTTALCLLENFWKDLPESVDGRLRFRVQANMAACLLRLGQTKEAAEKYLSAYDFAPYEPKAFPLRILGQVLQGRFSEAVQEGVKAIGGACDQAQLTAQILAAKARLPEEPEPFAFIPIAVDNDVHVILAKIEYLRVHDRRKEWRKLAKDGVAQYPENKFLRLSAADAVIDQGVEQYQANPRSPLSPDLREAIVDAASELRKQLNTILKSENSLAIFSAAVSCNLVTAYRLLREFSAAREVLNECLVNGLTDETISQLDLLVALETHDLVTAARLLEAAEPSRDTTFGKLQVYYGQGRWGAIAELASDPIPTTLSLDDRAYFEALLLIAAYKLKELDNPKTSVDALIAKHPNQAIVPIMLYEIAKDERDDVWAAQLFKQAMALKNTLNPASRSMLSRIAENQGDADAIVDILDGFVEPSIPSDDLETLAKGFANARVQQRSIRFVNSLSAEIRKLSFFARVTGAIFFNSGDLKRAEEAFRQAIENDPSSLPAQLGLLGVLCRLDRDDEVRDHLGKISPATLHGAAVHRLRLSQILVTFGYEEVGLEIAYITALQNQNDLTIVRSYVGMMLFSPSLKTVVRISSEIQIDDWVELERNGTRQAVIIEDASKLTSSDNLRPSDPLAQKLIGQKDGAEIRLVPFMGAEQICKVSTHKHKYLYLLHKLMDEAASRFSGAVGFYQVEATEGDVTPILEQARALAKQSDETFDLYKSRGFPIALVGKLSGRTSPEFAHEIVRRGETVKTCLGNPPERSAAFRRLRTYRQSGVVLDTYTAWVVQSLDLASVLKRLFKRVALPQSSLDELVHWRSRFDHQDDEPQRSIGFVEGQYFHNETPAVNLKAAFDRINLGIEKLRSEVEVLPAVAPDNAATIEGALFSFDQTLFDPAYVANGEGLLLLSDDFHFRGLALELFGAESAWLQAALMLAKEERLLELKDYARSIVGLAALRHDYLSVDRDVLLSIADRDKSENMDDLAWATAFIGSENADFLSNHGVAQSFLFNIWGRPPLILSGGTVADTLTLPDLRRAKAAGIVLERLAELFMRTVGVRVGFANLVTEVDKFARGTWSFALPSYLRDWVRGHFIY